MNKFLKLSSSSHFKSETSTRKIMLLVIIALVPSLIASIIFYGPKAGYISLIGVVSAIIAELIAELMRKRGCKSILDGSAALTGLLIAFNLSPNSPLWLPVLGSFVGVWFGKMVFGGLGFNIFNPALIGRAFLVAAYPTLMTANWFAPVNSTNAGFTSGHISAYITTVNVDEKVLNELDAITSATPLGVLKDAKRVLNNPDATDQQKEISNASLRALYSFDNLKNLFLGKVGGSLGETSALLLLIGGIFLCFLGIVNWRLPFFYIGTVFVLSWLIGGANGFLTGNPLFAVLSGGLMLGAFFMATDMVTSPVSNLGQILFGVCAGILVVIIRAFGGYPEGVAYSILIMNAFTPLIDRYIKPKKFGNIKKEEGKIV